MPHNNLNNNNNDNNPVYTETLFKDQVHERQKFKVNIQGNEFDGIYHEGQVQWFNPQPKNDYPSDQVDQVESAIHQSLSNQSNEQA